MCYSGYRKLIQQSIFKLGICDLKEVLRRVKREEKKGKKETVFQKLSILDIERTKKAFSTFHHFLDTHLFSN